MIDRHRRHSLNRQTSASPFVSSLPNAAKHMHETDKHTDSRSRTVKQKWGFHSLRCLRFEHIWSCHTGLQVSAKRLKSGGGGVGVDISTEFQTGVPHGEGEPASAWGPLLLPACTAPGLQELVSPNANVEGSLDAGRIWYPLISYTTAYRMSGNHFTMSWLEVA